MTYLLIVISLAFIAAGALGLHAHDRGGIPFLLIGVAALLFIAKRTWPHRTTGGEGGE